MDTKIISQQVDLSAVAAVVDSSESNSPPMFFDEFARLFTLGRSGLVADKADWKRKMNELFDRFGERKTSENFFAMANLYERIREHRAQLALHGIAV